MIQIRCSSLPHLFQCAAPLGFSERGDAVSIDEWNEIGPTGTAGHRAMREIALGREPDLLTLAEAEGVGDRIADLEYCVSRGRALWRTLSPFFPDPMFEREFSHNFGEFNLTGTLDMHARGEDEHGQFVIGLDWKFSMARRDTYIHQMYGYALLLMLAYQLRRVKFVIAYPRLGKWDAITFIADDSDRTSDDDKNAQEWMSEVLLGQIVRNRATYRPGPACDHCRFKAECPGRRQMVRSAVEDLSIAGGTIEDIINGLMDPARRAEIGPRVYSLYERAKDIASVCERLIDNVKKSCHEVGPLPIGDGRVLKASYTTRESINGSLALPVLRSTIDPAIVDAAAKVSIAKGALEKAIKDSMPPGSPRGAGGKRFAEIMDQLRAVNATNTSTSLSLEIIEQGDSSDDRSQERAGDDQAPGLPAAGK